MTLLYNVKQAMNFAVYDNNIISPESFMQSIDTLCPSISCEPYAETKPTFVSKRLF